MSLLFSLGAGLNHKFRRCRKSRCREPLCRAYREGVAEGQAAGYAAGYQAGRLAGDPS